MDLRDLRSNRKGSLMPTHPLNNFKMQKYYQNEPRFNGVILEIIYG